MADQSYDTDPNVLRDRLLTQAERGEITKEQAEAEAAAQGLGSFERKPELPRLDPKLKSHWSIVMAVAWIGWRDFGLVREQDPQFCSACFHWIYRKWKDASGETGKSVERTGYFLETRLVPTVSRLSLLDQILRAQGNAAVMTILEATDALWQALSEGRLIALGFDAHGVLVEIPPREWAYLCLRGERGRDVLRYDAVNRFEPFTQVTLRQSDLLRLWPLNGEFPALRATVIDNEKPTGRDGAATEDNSADESSNIFGIATKAKRSRWQIDHVQQALSMEFPDGVPPNLIVKEIRHRIVPTFEKNSWKLPSIDSVARALGRRKVG